MWDRLGRGPEVGSLVFRRIGVRPLWLELSEEADKAVGGHIAQGCGC